MKQVSYNIVALDPENNSWLDTIDGEFETLKRAKKFLEQHILRNIEENYPEDRVKLVIQKITREYI